MILFEDEQTGRVYTHGELASLYTASLYDDPRFMPKQLAERVNKIQSATTPKIISYRPEHKPMFYKGKMLVDENNNKFKIL